MKGKNKFWLRICVFFYLINANVYLNEFLFIIDHAIIVVCICYYHSVTFVNCFFYKRQLCSSVQIVIYYQPKYNNNLIQINLGKK